MKKFIALTLVFVMCLSLIPASFAEELVEDEVLADVVEELDAGHYHEFDEETWVAGKDANGNLVHYRPCKDVATCNLKTPQEFKNAGSPYGACYDHDSDGYCDACGQAVQHHHVYDTGWTNVVFDANNDDFRHYHKCIADDGYPCGYGDDVNIYGQYRDDCGWGKCEDKDHDHYCDVCGAREFGYTADHSCKCTTDSGKCDYCGKNIIATKISTLLSDYVRNTVKSVTSLFSFGAKTTGTILQTVNNMIHINHFEDDSKATVVIQTLAGILNPLNWFKK